MKGRNIMIKLYNTDDIKAVIIMPDGTNQYAKINELSFIDDLSIIYC